MGHETGMGFIPRYVYISIHAVCVIINLVPSLYVIMLSKVPLLINCGGGGGGGGGRFPSKLTSFPPKEFAT